MKPVVDEQEKLDETGGPPERGYGAWMRVKIERGLAQSRDRDAMIPVEQVLRNLALKD